MTNFAITQQESLDSVNYLLSGPSSIGNDFTGVFFDAFEYCTGDQIPPYMTVGTENPTPPPDYLPPSPPPPVDQYIETDCFAIVDITDPRQQIVVAAQCRPFAQWTASIPSNFTFYFSINRYEFPNILYYPTTIIEYPTAYTNWSTPGVDVDFGQKVFLNVTDEPGKIGRFYYWLEFYVQTDFDGVVTGDFALEYIGAQQRSISVSLVKP
jgi:hypothetical protein